MEVVDSKSACTAWDTSSKVLVVEEAGEKIKALTEVLDRKLSKIGTA